MHKFFNNIACQKKLFILIFFIFYLVNAIKQDIHKLNKRAVEKLNILFVNL